MMMFHEVPTGFFLGGELKLQNHEGSLSKTDLFGSFPEQLDGAARSSGPAKRGPYVTSGESSDQSCAGDFGKSPET